MPPPRRPTGGTGIFLLLVLGLVLVGLLIWAWTRADPGTPNPVGTANPKVLPATPSGGARPLH
jgi:hypothetical protein